MEAKDLAVLLCQLLAQLWGHADCAPMMLDSAVGSVLHVYRRRGEAFGVHLLADGGSLRRDLCLLSSSGLARVAGDQGRRLANLYRLLSSTHPAGEVLHIAADCPADSLPRCLGLVVQEACEGLEPLLRVVSQIGRGEELSPNCHAAAKSTLASFRCWHKLPADSVLQAMGEQLGATRLLALRRRAPENGDFCSPLACCLADELSGPAFGQFRFSNSRRVHMSHCCIWQSGILWWIQWHHISQR